MALSLDGPSATRAGGASAPSQVINIAVAAAGEVIIIYATLNGGPVVSVTSSPALTWTLRAAVSVPNFIEEWYAISAAATTYAVTVTATANNYISVDGFAVIGANTVTPFDVNGSLPATAGAALVTFSTTAATTMVIGAYRDSNLSYTAGSGFTTIQGSGNFTLSEYQLYSSAQTSTTLTTTGASATPIGIADALIPAAPTTTLMGAICM